MQAVTILAPRTMAAHSVARAAMNPKCRAEMPASFVTLVGSTAAEDKKEEDQKTKQNMIRIEFTARLLISMTVYVLQAQKQNLIISIAHEFATITFYRGVSCNFTHPTTTLYAV